ncbi:hypothetical protein T484DRAFT_2529376 [Baffinella frigidus]|nr:hypothetical protein T484DRAFT_2529376 [Cryptophyta sp. CCMP2293]
MGCSQSLMAEAPGEGVETDELYVEERKGGKRLRTTANVDTPVMERLWRVRPAALQSSSMQGFANLLSLNTNDLKGGVRTFTRLSRKGFLDVKRLGDVMELPALKEKTDGMEQEEGGRVLLSWFFSSFVKTLSTDSPRNNMDFRAFLVCCAMLRNVSQKEERLRFWFNVMQTSRDPDAMIEDAVPVEQVVAFLCSVLLAKSQSMGAPQKKARSKVVASVQKLLADVTTEQDEEQVVTFAGFVRACVYSNPALLASMTEMTQQLARVFRPGNLGGNKNDYSQMKIKARARLGIPNYKF